MNRLFRKIDHFMHPPKGEIIMLHRVVSDGAKLSHNRQFDISPANLQLMLQQYRQRGYWFASIDDVYDMQLSRKYTDYPFVCITLDDGYKDNLTEALPVFKQYDCPFCVYVASGFPDYTAFLWWYMLEAYIMDNSEITLPSGNHLTCDTIETKNKTFETLHSLISAHLNGDVRLWIAENMPFILPYEKGLINRMALSEDQLCQLTAEPLCTIGAHTINHVFLSHLTKDEKIKEIQGSKSRLEQIINSPISHFSYPYGDFDAECVDVVRKSGFHTAVMAWGGGVRSNSNIYALPRIKK